MRHTERKRAIRSKSDLWTFGGFQTKPLCKLEILQKLLLLKDLGTLACFMKPLLDGKFFRAYRNPVLWKLMYVLKKIPVEIVFW